MLHLDLEPSLHHSNLYPKEGGNHDKGSHPPGGSVRPIDHQLRRRNIEKIELQLRRHLVVIRGKRSLVACSSPVSEVQKPKATLRPFEFTDSAA